MSTVDEDGIFDLQAFQESPSDALDAPANEKLVTVAVSDRGVGIAPPDQERIFAKFGQVGERRGGTGLGLTFCKLVVEAHGGRIWVESQSGEGSTFFFTLPTSQPRGDITD